MKKINKFKKMTTLFSLIVLLTWGQKAWGQTNLPTSWDWTGTAPTGWTGTALGGTYTSSPYYHSASVSGKYTLTGQNFVIYFNSTPGTLSYWIYKNGTTSSYVFTVQESANGIDYTTLKLHNNSTNPLTNTTWINFTAAPLSTTRYIRFYYTNRDVNIAIDDISISSGGSDITPPTVSSLTPSDDATNVTVNANLIIVFNESVVAGTAGSITIYNSDDTEFESIPYNDSRITFSGSNVTINPTLNFANSSDYYVQISATAIADAAGNGFAGITDNTTWNFTTSATNTKKILFDASSGQSLASADWIVDADTKDVDWNSSGNCYFSANQEANGQFTPTPSSPTAESNWSGGNSRWAYELYLLGYSINSLPPCETITYGVTTNVWDLSYFDVFVCNEPNVQFTAAEKTAILTFVQNGGGLYMGADHGCGTGTYDSNCGTDPEADRNTDGWNSTEIWNDLMTGDPFGIQFNNNSVTSTASNRNALVTDPIIYGSSGTVSSISFNDGASMCINNCNNPTAKGVISNTTAYTTNAWVAYASYGSGRVVGVGDSSPTGDDTGDTNGETRYNNFADANNGAMLKNAVIWLAEGNPRFTASTGCLTGFTYSENAGPSTPQTFTLNGYNFTGSGTITLTAPADYEISSDGSTWSGTTITLSYSNGIIEGQSKTISVRLKAGLVQGSYNNEQISISGASASTLYIICSGTVTAPVTAPEINIQGGSPYADITDGSTAISTIIGTDFGSVDIVSGTLVLTFKIQNLGNANLNLTGIAPTYVTISGTNASDFSITANPSTPVAASGFTTFSVTFNPSGTGQRNATLTISNNDANEGTYDFAIQGNGTAPEMNVKQNTTNIADGTGTYSFGTICTTGGSSTVTFTIENLGNSVLTLTGVSPYVTLSNTTDFSLTQTPGNSIAASGGTTTFQITFDPASDGAKTCTVSIANDDSDENPYNFTVSGTGSTVTPTISITSNDADNTICSGTSVTFTASITNGGTTPSYQWELHNGTAWANVGTNSNIFTTTTLANGNKVRCTLTSNIACASVTNVISNEITTSVNSLPANPDGSITGTTPACGSSVLTYNGTDAATAYWQTTTSGTSTTNLANATYDANIVGTNTYYVRAKNANNCWSTGNASFSVTITAENTISTQPSNMSVSAGESATFNLTASNVSGYQWYYRVNSSSSWNSIVGATNASYSTGATTLDMNGYQYKCEVTGNSPCTTKTSDIVTLTVNVQSCTAENFGGVGTGTTDITATINDFTETTGWEALKVYKANGGDIKIGASTYGYLVTPTNNLTGGGTISVKLKELDNNESVTVKMYHAPDGVTWTEIASSNTITYLTWTTLSGTIPIAGNTNGGTPNSKIKIETSGTDPRIWADDFIINCNAPIPAVNVSLNQTSASEDGPTSITVTATAEFNVTGDQDVTLTVSGSASTADYLLNGVTQNSVTLTIPSGQKTATTSFLVVDDAVIEGTENATFTITRPVSETGYYIGNTDDLTIPLYDNEPQVNLSVSRNSGAECLATSTITVTVSLNKTVGTAQTVTLGTAGTATLTSDYTLPGISPVTIPANELSVVLTFTILTDALPEGSETAILTLSSPSSGMALGDNITETIYITDANSSILAGTFESGLDSWTQFSYAGTGVWTRDITGTGFPVALNGANSTSHWVGILGYNTTKDDWFVSPSFDLSSYYDCQLNFWYFYSNDATGSTHPQVKISKDYAGNPTTATWVNITPTYGSYGNWIQSTISLASLDNYVGPIYLAFHFTGGTDDDENWSIDEVSVTGNCGYGGMTTITTGANAEPTTISSLIDTQGESVINFDFNVNDDGLDNNADTKATLLSQIVISQGNGNSITDWSTVIAGAELTDGSNILSGTVNALNITFSGITNGDEQLGEVDDNESKNFKLKVWLKSDLGALKTTIDGNILAFKIDKTGITTTLTSSKFETPGNTIESGETNNVIDVQATAFNFIYTPIRTSVNTNFTATVEAVDANGNRDLEYTSVVTLSNYTGLGNILPISGAAFVAGYYSWTNVQNDIAEVFKLQASDMSISGISNNINMVESFYYQGFTDPTNTTVPPFIDNWNFTGGGVKSNDSKGQTYGWSMKLVNGDPAIIMDNATGLENYTDIQFSLSFAATNTFDANLLEVSVSWDGTTWESYTEIARGLSGSTYNFNQTGATYPVNPYIISIPNGTTQFRVRILGSSTYYIDDVQITGIPRPLTLYTLNFAGATTSTAIVNAELVNNAGQIVTEKGIVYSISSNPTTSDNKVVAVGTGIGYFTSDSNDAGTETDITGLAPSTTYYTRAYVITNLGTTYGNELSFTTCAVGADCLNNTDIMITEYIESNGVLGGDGDDDAIEIFNGTGCEVNLKHYSIKKDQDGNGTFASEYELGEFILADGQVYVIAYDDNDSDPTRMELKPTGVADVRTANAALAYSGDDQLQLCKNHVVIDHVGVPNPGTYDFGSNVTFTRRVDIVKPRTLADLPSDCNPNTNGEWIVCPVNYYDDLGTYRVIYDWQGDISSDWYNPQNWANTKVPCFSSYARITNVKLTQPAWNFPVIGQSAINTWEELATAYQITVYSGASLTIANTGELTVSGFLINKGGAAGLVIESDATGTGSLIQENGAVNATVKRYLTGGANYSVWHTIFSPLNSVTASQFGGYLSGFNESAPDFWNNITTFGYPSLDALVGTGWETASGVLSTNCGYFYAGTTTVTTTLTSGTLCDVNKSFTVTYNDHTSLGDANIPNASTDNTSGITYVGCQQDWSVYDGWNMIGNPYASAIDLLAINLSSETDIEKGFYIWDSGAKNYKYLMNGGTAQTQIAINQDGTISGDDPANIRYVPSGQGFFVKATETAGTGGGQFIIPKSARTHLTHAFWKSDNTEQQTITNLFRMNIEQNGFTDETVTWTTAGASDNHDGDFDLYKRFSMDTSKPQIYTSNANETNNFALNTFSEIGESKQIPVGIYIGTAGVHTINFTENTYENVNIYLEDTYKNITINTKLSNSYTFSSSTGLINNRFILRFAPNNAPVANQIQDVIILEDEFWSVDLSDVFTDVDLLDKLTIQFTQTPGWLTENNMVISGTPSNKEVGIYTLKMQATDLAGASTETSIKITVLNINDAPYVSENPENKIAIEDQNFEFALASNTFVDIDANEELQISSKLADGNALPSWLIFDNSTLTFTGSPSNSEVGLYHIILTAADLSGATAETKFILEVVNVNDAPELIIPIADIFAEVGTEFFADLDDNTFVDIDANDVLKYTALLPSWINFNSFSLTFYGTPENEGTTEIKLTASDLAGESANDIFNIIVSPATSVIDADDFKVSIYPNPSNGIFVINCNTDKSFEVKVTDITGKAIYHSTLNTHNSLIDLSRYAAGVYYIELTIENQSYKEKLIKL